MNRTLSSAWTFFLKFLFPVIWIAVFALRVAPRFWHAGAITRGAVHGAAPARVVWTFLLVWLAVAAFAVVVCAPLKRVRLDDGALFVSNFLREWRVPTSLVTEVTQNRWLQVRPITIRLRADVGCGTRIVFIPPRYIRSHFRREDAVVEELRRLSASGDSRDS